MFDTIIDLLARQECVIVPGFGGFVVNDCVAKLDGGKFFPPRKELVFNARLVHNDGDLAHALMKSRSCSFDEANKFVSDEVASIWAALKNDGVYAVPNFGVFTMKSGKIAFLQKNLKVACGDSFGLSEFYFPTLDKNHGKSSAVSSPSSSFSARPVKTFAIGAAAVVAFLLVGQPVNNSSYQQDMASLIPMKISQTSLEKELEVKKMELSQAQSELEAYHEADASYYLIVSDFSDEESAVSFIRKAKDKSLSLLCIDNHFYISSFSAKTKSEISDFCLSSEKNWSDAYVLSVFKLNDELK